MNDIALNEAALAETQAEFDYVPPGLVEAIVAAWNRRTSPSQRPAVDVVEALRSIAVGKMIASDAAYVAKCALASLAPQGGDGGV